VATPLFPEQVGQQVYLQQPRGIPLETRNGGKSEPTEIDELINDEELNRKGMSINTRNIPPMADSLEPSKPSSVVNASGLAHYRPLNQIQEEDPDIDKCDEEELNDREMTYPSAVIPPPEVPTNAKPPQRVQQRPLVQKPVTLPSQAS
jgi:hypothetical protein